METNMKSKNEGVSVSASVSKDVDMRICFVRRDIVESIESNCGIGGCNVTKSSIVANLIEKGLAVVEQEKRISRQSTAIEDAKRVNPLVGTTSERKTTHRI